MPELEKSTVILRGVAHGSISGIVRECLELCHWDRWVGRDATVVIKPNLCTAVPEKVAAANTDRAIAEAVCEVLLSRTKRIYIAESDLLRQKAREAFEVSGYVDLARKLGVELVNFSEVSWVRTQCEPVGEIELPRLLLESDVFITLPVLKTHALTYFTGALKNQWGCVPRYYDRNVLHRFIDPLLASLLRVLRPKLALMDGIVGMEGRGPVNGKPRRLNVILASRDLVALDATAMRLVGLDPHRARHIVLAARQGLGRISFDEIEVDGEWERHATQFEAPVRDWANEAAFYMAQYPWFVRHILENDSVYYPLQGFVRFLRKVGVVGG